MVHQISTPVGPSYARRWLGGAGSPIVIAVAAVCASLLIAASLLWLHYGTAVFFEMIASGIAACI